MAMEICTRFYFSLFIFFRSRLELLRFPSCLYHSVYGESLQLFSYSLLSLLLEAGHFVKRNLCNNYQVILLLKSLATN